MVSESLRTLQGILILLSKIAVHFQCSAQVAIADLHILSRVPGEELHACKTYELLLVQHLNSKVLIVLLRHDGRICARIVVVYDCRQVIQFARGRVANARVTRQAL
jgi:hypothetical protein